MRPAVASPCSSKSGPLRRRRRPWRLALMGSSPKGCRSRGNDGRIGRGGVIALPSTRTTRLPRVPPHREDPRRAPRKVCLSHAAHSTLLLHPRLRLITPFITSPRCGFAPPDGQPLPGLPTSSTATSATTISRTLPVVSPLWTCPPRDNHVMNLWHKKPYGRDSPLILEE
jgi:hypothetical protein